MKRLLSKITLLAFATFALLVPAAAASPIIDPPGNPPLLVKTATQPVMDGWYSAAVATTRYDRAKKHPKNSIYYRSATPVSGHGPVLP
jgi:hypothetical protein